MEGQREKEIQGAEREWGGGEKRREERDRQTDRERERDEAKGGRVRGGRDRMRVGDTDRGGGTERERDTG